MKHLFLILVFLVGAESVNDVSALDAPPPPDPKTLQWTIELANSKIPLLTTKETPIWSLLGGFGSSMEMPGFYLDIDFSEVEERTKKNVTIEIKDTTWLAALAQVADMIDSDIQISPGVIKLVPRPSINPEESNPKGEQGVDPNA